jgi:hypothetical protein
MEHHLQQRDRCASRGRRRAAGIGPVGRLQPVVLRGISSGWKPRCRKILRSTSLGSTTSIERTTGRTRSTPAVSPSDPRDRGA